MRMTNWLFIVSVLLFISGIGFIIASARTRQVAAVSAPSAAPALPPVASVKQIMAGIVMPAASKVWDSVSTIVDKGGVQENVPKTEEEWAVVGANAAALIESANLLTVGNRAVDQGDWVKMSKAMADAAQTALKATTDKNPDGILAAGEKINETCDNCHEKYQR
jgi:cytochrome c556